VTLLREGMRVQLHATHLPNVNGGFTWCRVLQRTIRQDQATPSYYWVDLELSPLPAGPQGAFDLYTNVSPCVPILPHATTPGRLLLALVSDQEAVSTSTAIAPTFHDTVAAGAAAQTWTQHAWVSADGGSGVAIGPPGAVGFGIFSRYVRPGETTVTPTDVYPNAGASVHVWIYEIDGATTPTLATSHASNAYYKNTAFTVGSALAGRIVGGGLVALVDYGDRPTFTTLVGSTLQLTDGFNNPANPGCGNHGWHLPWTWLGQSANGSTPLSFTWTQPCDPSYDFEGSCGAAVVVPGLNSDLPTIPYPANQVG
jgi:hypothetical protein